MKKNQLAVGLPDLKQNLPTCVACQYGKQSRLPFAQKSTWRSSHKLQLVHTDVRGPLRTPSLKGSKYYIAFIDDYTRYCWIFFLNFKSEVADVFWKYKALVENQSGAIIQVIRTNNGTEYTSERFNNFCEEAGIEHQLTAPYTPQQNGVVKRDKLDKKAEVGIFVGYNSQSKTYRVYMPHADKVIVSRDVKFMEDDKWSWDAKKNQNFKFLDENIDDIPLRGTKSLSNIYQRCNVAVFEPVGFNEAVEDKKGRVTMQEELNMIEKNNTWELVDRPTHKKAIGVKWVYRTKLNSDGSVNKHKAKLVVKGYAQMFGVDFSKTFAPVARLDTIRMLLVLDTQKGWKIYQLDVKSAFLNGYLKEEIFVEQPEGFAVKDKEDKDIVTQSTAEAKYIATATVANQALWIRKLLTYLNMEQTGSTQVFVDSQAAISIAKKDLEFVAPKSRRSVEQNALVATNMLEDV
ncbi:Retrovirus-related Pol polyprotein from transposon TNT 1-94 [Vitis vinifera]|uniref:Retrovirus-related Pol polyprotein from transposon TNT 1-94 n=1 Tax=Vitis vinifera TaxID=29760 RepID=A0A438CLS0_VITVI|nr:Retrovirus-related Pol polyprotein from transposon TNT 1-94 [Vitis vinifera]